MESGIYQTPVNVDPRLGRATFGDLVSIAAGVIRERIGPFLLAGLVSALPLGVLTALMQHRFLAFEEPLDLPDMILLEMILIGLAIFAHSVLVRPVVHGVVARGSIDQLAGSIRPLTEIADQLVWWRIIAADFYRALAFAAAAIGSAVALMTGIYALSFVIPPELGVSTLFRLVGMILAGMVLFPVVLVASFYVFGRLGVAVAALVAGYGTAAGACRESWRIMRNRTGQTFWSAHWMRYSLLFLTGLGVTMVANLAILALIQPLLDAITGWVPAGVLLFLLTQLVLAPTASLGTVIFGVIEGVYFADLAERLRPPSAPKDPEVMPFAPELPVVPMA